MQDQLNLSMRTHPPSRMDEWGERDRGRERARMGVRLRVQAHAKNCNIVGALNIWPHFAANFNDEEERDLYQSLLSCFHSADKIRSCRYT